MSETAKHPPGGQAGKRVVVWLRSPPVRRGLLVTAVLGACFVWAMLVVGMSFAMVDRGVRQWWLVLVFGLLVLVVALAAGYGVLVSFRFRRGGDAGGPARPAAVPSARAGAASPTPRAPTATVAARPAGAGGGGARQAAARPSRPPAAVARRPVEPLSRRELEVLAQLAAGRSNREIAEALYVAPGTVKAHLHHVFRKLEAAGRLQAVAHARQAGLLDAHDPE